MPTLDDLHAAFAELEQQAPERVALPQPSRRRRWPAAVAAAACVVTIAGFAVSMSRSDSSSSPSTPQSSPAQTVSRQPADGPFRTALPAPADGRSPVLAYGFAASDAGGARVTPDLITRTYQHATVTTSTTTPGELFVFYGGTYDPTTAERGDQITVNGRPGYFGAVPVPDTGEQDALVWQYADNGWALVYVQPSGDPAAKGDGGSSAAARARAEQRQAQHQAELAYVRALELQLAEQLQPANVPLRSPVRIPSDSGLYLQSMSDAPDGSIGLDRGAAGTDPLGTAYTIGWSPSPLTVDDKPGSGVTTINGRTWAVFHDKNGAVTGLGLVLDTDWGLTVTPAAGSATDAATLEQFVGSLQFASDPANSGTWFDATTALP